MEPKCLDDGDWYCRLDNRVRTARRYWYLIAAAPFAFVMLLARLFSRIPSSLLDSLAEPRWHGQSVFDVFVGSALAWAMIVPIYVLVLMARWFLIKCPRCGWRFGLGRCLRIVRAATTFSDSHNRCRPAWPLLFPKLQVSPILPHPNLYRQRHAQLVDTFHLLLNEGAHLVELRFRNFEDELVMHLQGHL